jgi:hypothetical protein
MSAFTNVLRRAAGALALCHSTVGALLFSCHPAAALYAEVKPTPKVGVDCIERVSVLAPRLTTCAIAGAKVRIWCPNGQMFEGKIEPGGVQSALARSLCNMTQVP